MDTELDYIHIALYSMNAREPGEVCQISKQAHVPHMHVTLLCT